MGHLHKKTKKAEILIKQKIPAFLFLLRFYLVCFLLKTAVAIPLKKSRKRKINVFLRGSCFLFMLFYFSVFTAFVTVVTPSFVSSA